MAKKPQNAFPELPKIPAIAGVRIAGVAAGLKDNGKHDLFVAELARGSTIAGNVDPFAMPRHARGMEQAPIARW